MPYSVLGTGRRPSLAAGMDLAERFRLVKLLGEGGIASVWLAEDLQLHHERVACKVLRENSVVARRGLADLKREVLLTRRLRHPAILAVYTFWDVSQAQFFTMEYVDGPSLAAAMDERDRPFTLDEVLPWVRDLSDALDYAHDQGVLHRDVKPGNVLLQPDGRVRLADFGIASMALMSDDMDIASLPQGTLPYISPEQLTSARPDPRSDLYSLAATTYALLRGTPPFDGPEIIAQIQIRPATPVSHLSEDVNRVLLRGLSKSPTTRYSTCGDFYNEIAAAASTSTCEQPPTLTGVHDLNRETVVLGGYEIGTRRTRLGRMLIEAGHLTQDQLAEALMDQGESGRKLGEIVVEKGYLDENTLIETLSTQLDLPLANLAEEVFDETVARRLSSEDARRFGCLPIRHSPYGVLVAMSDPLDMAALDHLERTYGTTIEVVLATVTDIGELLDRFFPSE